MIIKASEVNKKIADLKINMEKDIENSTAEIEKAFDQAIDRAIQLTHVYITADDVLRVLVISYPQARTWNKELFASKLSMMAKESGYIVSKVDRVMDSRFEW